MLLGEPAAHVADWRVGCWRIEPAQRRLGRLALVVGEVLLGQPHPALMPERVGGRTTRDEIAVQDRLHPVLPGALTDWPAAGDLPAERVRLALRLPTRSSG